MRAALASLLLWCSTLPQPVFADPQIFAAVLPSSRSVQVNAEATLFATLINGGDSVGLNCGISSDSLVQTELSFFTTDSATNAVVGAANALVDLDPGEAQSFLVSLRSAAPLAPAQVELVFGCENSVPAPTILGVSTFLYSASVQPEPDLIALGVTPTADGVSVLPDVLGSNAFSVATFNVGVAGVLRARAAGSRASLPVEVALCRTNSSTGACLAAPSSQSVEFEAPAGSTATFGVFLTATADVPFDPATNRVTVEFIDAAEVVRGSTSVAVRLRNSFDPLAISSENALMVTDRLHDSLAILPGAGALVVNAAAILRREREVSVANRCGRSGTYEFRLVDANGSGEIDAGDVLNLRYEDCVAVQTGFAFRGELRYLIDETVFSSGDAAFIAGEIQVLSPIQFDETEEPSLVGGAFTYSYTVNPNSAAERFGAAVSGPVIIQMSQSLDYLSNLQLTRSNVGNDSSFGYRVSYSARLRSESLLGTVNCDAPVVEGVANAIPNGALNCTGANNSALTVNNTGLLAVDSTGTGNFVEQPVFDWPMSGIDTLLGSPRSRPLAVSSFFDEPPRLSAELSLDLAIDGFAVSGFTNQVYVINAAGLLEIDPATGQTGDSILLPHQPFLLVASANGELLHIGYRDVGAIQTFNLRTGELGELISLGNSAAGLELFPVSIAAAPTTPGRIAVARTQSAGSTLGNDFVVFDQGSMVGGTETSFGEIQDLVFENDTRLLSANSFSLRRWTMDGGTVSQSGTELVGFVDSGSGRSTFLNGLLYSRGGTVVEPESASLVASLQGGRGLLPDPANNRLYSATFRRLNVYDLDSLAQLGEFRMDDDRFVLGFEQLGSRLILALDNRLLITSLENIAEITSEPCRPIDVSLLGINSTAAQIGCGVTDAVYAPQTNELLAVTQSDIGPQGNSLLRINVDSAQVEQVIPLSGAPNHIELSADESQLFVAYNKSNRLTAVDLASNTLTSLGRLVTEQTRFVDGGEQLLLRPENVGDLVASPVDPQEFIVLPTQASPVLVRGSTQLSGHNLGRLDALYYRADNPSSLVGLQGDTFFRLRIQGSVLQNAGQVRDLVQGGSTVFADNRLYTNRGQQLNVEILLVEQNYDLNSATGSPFAQAVTLDTASNRVLFFTPAIPGGGVAFDLETGEIQGELQLPIFGDLDDVLRTGLNIFIAESPDHLVLAGPDGILIIDKDEAYPGL